MKHSTKKTSLRVITRRAFARQVLTTAGAIAGAPAFLRGQNLNNTLNIAFIACGGRANASLGELTIVPGRNPGSTRRRPEDPHAGPHPDENVTVLYDVNDVALDSASQRYPRTKKFTDLRRAF